MFSKNKSTVSNPKRAKAVLQECSTILDDTLCEIGQILEHNVKGKIKLTDKEKHDVQ